MSVASWLEKQPRRIKDSFRDLINAGRSEKRAKKLIQLVELASPEEFRPVKGSKGARFFLPGAPKTAPTISRTEFIKRAYGASPGVLAAERKAGLRSYKSAASEEQAAKQIVTRKKFARRGFGGVEHEHAFVNRAGHWQSEIFRGRNLAIMQEYRTDWQTALRTNDASLLSRYKKMFIREKGGRQVFPATDLDAIRAFLDRLATRMRTRFEREVNYPKKHEPLAA